MKNELYREIITGSEIYDSKDPLADYKSHFKSDDPHLIYLDGNSLGMLPAKTPGHISDVVNREWGSRLIRSYNETWWTKPLALGDRIAGLVGAQTGEVVVCDSVSVNMFKILVAALRDKKDRKEIVSDELNFGTDLYIIQGVADMLGRDYNLELMKSSDGITIPDDEIERCVTDETALVSLSHVSFRSSFMYDMKRVTEHVHSKGAYMLWDLCHAVGAVEIDLGGSGADFAVGCTYKYLNAGPGAVSFIYVRKELQERLRSPIWGWWGDGDPFSFNREYTPAQGIRQFLAGSVPVLSSATLERSLDIFEEAGMHTIREKSVALSTYFLDLFEKHLRPLGYAPGSPEKSEMRGSHVSLKHPEAFRICKALTDEEEGEWTIIPDFRAPDNIRIGIAPLYNSFRDLAVLTTELMRITAEKRYEKYDNESADVT